MLHGLASLARMQEETLDAEASVTTKRKLWATAAAEGPEGTGAHQMRRSRAPLRGTAPAHSSFAALHIRPPRALSPWPHAPLWGEADASFVKTGSEQVGMLRIVKIS